MQVTPVDLQKINYLEPINTALKGSVASTSGLPLHGLPFDQLLAQCIEKNIYSEDYNFNSKFHFPSLPGIASERLIALKKIFFEETITFRISYNGETIDLAYTFHELLSFEEGSNKLVGSYVKYILGSFWFRQCLKELELTCPHHPFFQKLFEQIDSKTIDIDLQHLNEKFKGESSGIWDDLAKFIAKKCPFKGPKEKIHLAVQECISGRCDIFFYNNKQNQIVCEARRIPLKTQEKLPIDLVLAKTMETPVLLSPQDLTIDLNCLAKAGEGLVGGLTAHGWKSIVDYLCRIYEFSMLTPIAWARSISYQTNFYRHLKPIDPELYKNLFTQCLMYGGPSSTIPYLLNITLKNHHHDEANSAVALLYNALANLETHPEFAKDSYMITSNFLRDKEATGFWGVMKDALKAFPFAVVAAMVELTGYASSETYLTHHNGASAILRMQDGLTLLQTRQPHVSMKVLADYLTNEPDEDTVEALSLFLSQIHPKPLLISSSIESQESAIKPSLQLISVLPKKLLPLGNFCFQLAIDPQGCLFDWKNFDLPEKEPFQYLVETLVVWSKDNRPQATLAIVSIYSALSSHIDFSKQNDPVKQIIKVNLAAGLTIIHMQLGGKKAIALNSYEELLFDCVSQLQNTAHMNIWISSVKFLSHLPDTRKKIITTLQSLLDNKRNLSLASSLLLFTTQERLISTEDECLLDLWMSVLENVSKHNTIPDSLKIWKKGSALGIFQSRLPYRFRSFLISYCERLFAFDSEDSNFTCHGIIESIPQPKQKDDYSDRMAELTKQSSIKLQIVQQNHHKLCYQINAFETHLKRASIDENTLRSLRQQCVFLLGKLTQIESVLEINRQNLINAKQLLHNPKVQSLFDNDQETYIKFLQIAIENAVFIKIEEGSLVSLIELQLQKGDPNIRLVKALFSLLKSKQTQLSSSLTDHLIRKTAEILNLAKENNLFEEAALFLFWIPPQKMKEIQPSTIIETTLWCATHLVTQNSARQDTILSYLKGLQNNQTIPADAFISEQITCYTKIINTLIITTPKESFTWIKFLYDILSKRAEKITEETIHTILAWSPSLILFQQFELIETGFTFVLDNNANYCQNLAALVTDIKNLFSQRHPHLYSRIQLQICSSEEPKVINHLVQQLLISSHSPENMDKALSLLERKCQPLNCDLEPIFRYLTTSEKETLKTRAIALQNQKNQAIIEDDKILEDKEFCREWLHMLNAAFPFIKNSEISLSHILTGFGPGESILRKCVEKHSFHKIGQTLFEKTMHGAQAMIKDIDKTPLLAKALYHVLQKEDYCHKNTRKHISDLVPKYFESKDKETFNAGGRLLFHLFFEKRDALDELEEEVKLISLYLKGMQKFSNPPDLRNVIVLDSLIKDFVLLRRNPRIVLDLDYEELKPFVRHLTCARLILPLGSLKNHFWLEAFRYYSTEYSSIVPIFLLSYMLYKISRRKNLEAVQYGCSMALFICLLHFFLRLSMSKRIGTGYA